MSIMNAAAHLLAGFSGLEGDTTIMHLLQCHLRSIQAIFFLARMLCFFSSSIPKLNIDEPAPTGIVSSDVLGTNPAVTAELDNTLREVMSEEDMNKLLDLLVPSPSLRKRTFYRLLCCLPGDTFKKNHIPGEDDEDARPAPAKNVLILKHAFIKNKTFLT